MTKKMVLVIQKTHSKRLNKNLYQIAKSPKPQTWINPRKKRIQDQISRKKKTRGKTMKKIKINKVKNKNTIDQFNSIQSKCLCLIYLKYVL